MTTPQTLTAKEEQLKSETWYVKLVYAHVDREWTFQCDGMVMEELRQAFLNQSVAHVKYAGTEVILNPAHMASMEFQQQQLKPENL